MAQFKSTAIPLICKSVTVGPGNLKFRVEIGNYFLLCNSEGNETVQSASMSFFFNSRTIGPRKLKFSMYIGNIILYVFLQFRMVWYSPKVLPLPFSVTL